jgi:arginase
VDEWGLLGAPVYTLASYKGMGESPKALRKQGIARALSVRSDLGDVGLSPLKKDVVEGRTKNLTAFRESTKLIHAAASSVAAERIIIIGGECSETLGAMAGLAEAFGGRTGMLWMDAHGDFNTSETSPSGYIGGMCLALACGKDHSLNFGIGGTPAPLADERLVHVGSRALDPPEVAAFNASPAKLYTAQQVKKSGAADVAEEAARHLENRSDWIACHLDVDVVDPKFLPSVNYPTPDGLTPDEASMMIRKLAGTHKLKALEVCAYNPAKDRGGSSAKVVIEILRSALG